MQHSLDFMIADQRDLFAFGGLTHDPQGVLAAVHRLARVGIELVANACQACVFIDHRFNCYRELRVAAFTHSEHRNTSGPFYDSELTLWHVQSLAYREGWA
jgi:hypothetical protein